MEYPREAIQKRIEGTVYVNYTVNAEGRLENLKVSRGIGFGCDEEALRVVGLLDDWTPGYQNGVMKKVQMMVPVAFKLSK